jgi:hypothetical protein
MLQEQVLRRVWHAYLAMEGAQLYGYPEGKEPRYFWNREQLGDGTLVYVEAVVLAREDDPN